MPEKFAPLQEGEVEVTNRAIMYVRQCHPSFLKGGQPSSQFLAEFPRDGGKLSGTRAPYVSATEAYIAHIRAGLKSAGAWGVTLDESTEAGTRVVDDSQMPPTEPARPRGHAYLDFRHFTKEERGSVVSHLLILFKKHGQLAVLGDYEEAS